MPSPIGNSTVLNVENDFTARLANVIERALNSVRETAMNKKGSMHLVSRMTTDKRLPRFSGNPLEWLNFKEIYEITSELGAYTDRDNIARLFEALAGEAREEVGTILATNRDSSAVMQTLELHYGNSNLLAQRVRSELYELPRIDTKFVSLIQFATRVKNAVMTFRSYKLRNHLFDSDLMISVGRKLPEAFQYAYARYAASIKDHEISELEKLSDFLFAEAKITTNTVLFDSVMTSKKGDNRRDGERRRDRRQRKENAFLATSARRDDTTDKCQLCSSGENRPSDCSEFSRKSTENRWKSAKRLRLCFGRLKFGHPNKDCPDREKCSKCDDYHHVLLHYIKNQGRMESNVNFNTTDRNSTKKNPGSSENK